MINTTYKDITLEQAEEYYSKGYIVVCDGDGWLISIKEEGKK